MRRRVRVRAGANVLFVSAPALGPGCNGVHTSWYLRRCDTFVLGGHYEYRSRLQARDIAAMVGALRAGM